jgi:RluA family pseudouridine synthase
MKRKVSTTIAPNHAEATILDFLSLRFTYHRRNQWEDLIQCKKVLLNGNPCVPSAILGVGDEVEYVNFDREEPPVSTNYSIVFEDRTLLVINKPENLPCHPGGRYFRNTLWRLLRTDHPGKSFFFVNRIDRETSGIVLLTKTALAATNCQQQFQSGNVRKNYLVVVEGNFPSGEFRADGFLARDKTSTIRKKQRFFSSHSGQEIPEDSRQCLTQFRLLDTHEGKSLVSASPITGRLHQIRATLFSLGYPVVGDKIYGLDDTLFLKFIENRLTEGDRNRLCLPRQALHAESLALTHPEDGRRLHFRVEMPEDMAALFNKGGYPWNPRRFI